MLQIGSRGAAVKAFQQTLVNAGFLTGKVDGIYGKMTSAAATAYYKIYSPAQPITVAPAPITTPVSTPVASSPTTTPSIVINSPKVGDVLTEGQTYNITWTASAGLPTNTPYSIYLENSKVGSIRVTGINNIYSQNSFSWTVPSILSYMDWAGAVAPQDGYDLFISSSYTSDYIFKSSVFKILPKNSSTSLIPGCASTSGYSTTNGVACNGTVPSIVVGCSITSGYSSTSGLACDGSGIYIPNSLACTATSAFNPYTGQPCSGTSTSTPQVSYKAIINGISYPSTGVDQVIKANYGDPVTISWQSNQSSCELSDSSTSFDKVENSSGSEVLNNLSIGNHTFIILCPHPLTTPYAKDDTLNINVVSASTPTAPACTSGFNPNTGFICGCTSNSGYSTTNGVACNGTVPSTVVGCSITSGYSSTSGLACDGSGTYNPNFPGCTPVSIFNPLNGEYCPGKAPITTPTPKAPTCTAGGFDPNTGFLCGCSSISGYSSIDGSSCKVN
jgi:peptidoglycan hydrolase-like protein with peptidoglycan-binding domain